MAPRGRPSAFKPEFVEQARKLCQFGATDVELADFFGVTINTIGNWKVSHADFLGACALGKEVADERVVKSLYQRAIGYTFDSEKVFQYQGDPVRVPVREHVPPDPNAAIFWLKNRRAKDWRDIRQFEHGDPGDFDRLNDAELLDDLRADASRLGLAPPESETAH